MINSYFYEMYMLEAEQEIVVEKIKKKRSKAVKTIRYYFKDNLQIPIVAPILKIESNRDKICDFISDFIDNNSEIFYDIGPMANVPFYEKEIKFLSDLFNIEIGKVAESDMQKVKNDSTLSKIISDMYLSTYEWTTVPSTIKYSPHKILVACMLVEALQNNYEDIIECCRYMHAFIDYPLFYKKYLGSKFPVKQNIMRYTIEHLSSKFRIRKMPNLLSVIKYDSSMALDNAIRKDLIDGHDMIIIDFVNDVRSRFNSTFCNIARQYHENYKKGATIFTMDGRLEDGSLIDKGGQGTLMTSIIENTYNKFISTSINNSVIPAIAENAKITVDNLTSHINIIMATKENKLFRIIEIIITSYFLKYPSSSGVDNNEFVSYGLELFRKSSNSKNELFIELKNIVNELWVKSILDLYNKYSSQSTINSYARAIFQYVVFTIRYHN